MLNESEMKKMITKTYFKYWGKAGRCEEEATFSYHLLPYHCLDVAAVGQSLLANHRSLLDFFVGHSGFEPKTLIAFVLYFLAMHDLGKFSEAFQGERDDLLFLLNTRKKSKVYDQRHDSLGFFLWRKQIAEDFCSSRVSEQNQIWQWLEFYEIWAQAFTGHHGQPPKGCDRSISRYFIPENIAAAKEFSRDCEKYFLEEVGRFSLLELSELLDKFRCLSWWLAGVAVLCDWLGSNRDFFHFCEEEMSLDRYWQDVALPSARKAVNATDILPIPAADGRRLSELFQFIEKPTPLQAMSESISVGEEPQLFILEDVTGAGKTEAAFMLLHRLMVLGKGEGAYIALPTMATANSMYKRTSKVYKQLFASCDRSPSLVLAHGARHLVDGFVDSVLPEMSLQDDQIDQIHESTASTSCNAWLADNRKKALLAHMGVGTIDQALLAVLRSRHQSLRLFGLRGKIVIVDEVHASDAYMHRLLQTLPTFHAAAGGSAILLSATLPQKMRRELVAAFAQGLGNTPPSLMTRGYPLLTHFAKKHLQENEVATRDEVNRNLSFSLMQDEKEALELITKKVKTGQCVAWIRNTVADAIETHQKLLEFLPGDGVILFHARFTLGDRLTIEEHVLSCFGKDSQAEQRGGKVIVATQVVEQSLDLDFDWLISDLAPIDLLIQRAGRLRRHARDFNGNTISGKDQRGEPVLYVLTPFPEQNAKSNWFGSFFPKAVKVYEDHGRLWLTVRYLTDHQKMNIPHDMREAIEYVYGENSEGEIPADLLEKSFTAEADSQAETSLARMNSISLKEGYSMPDHDWWDEMITPTRLGDPTINLRLARWDGKALRPWFDSDKNAWSLSEVNVRRKMATNEAPQADKQLAAAIEDVKDRWSAKKKKFCLLVAMTEVTESRWEGQVIDDHGEMVTLLYSDKFGLSPKKIPT